MRFSTCAVLLLAACDMPFLFQLPEIQPSNLAVCDDLVAPDAIVASLEGESVRLTWTIGAQSVEQALIERRSPSLDWQQLGEVPASPASYLDSTVARDDTYDYRLRLKVGNCFSPAREGASVTTPPFAPTLEAVASGTSVIVLDWVESNVNDVRHTIERSADLGTTYAPLVADLPPDSAHFEDTTVSADRRYLYRLRVFGANDTSAEAEAAAWTFAHAATSFTVSTVSPSALALSWVDTNAGARAYRVERAGALLTTVAGSSYEDQGLAPGSTHSYTIVVENEAGRSAAVEASNRTALLPTAAFTGPVAFIPATCAFSAPAAVTFDVEKGAMSSMLEAELMFAGADAYELGAVSATGVSATPFAVSSANAGPFSLTLRVTDTFGSMAESTLPLTLVADPDVSARELFSALPVDALALVEGRQPRRVGAVPSVCESECTGSHAMVSEGASHGCVLQPNGRVACFGDNGAGAVGAGVATADILNPREVCTSGSNSGAGCTGTTLSGVTQISAGDGLTCARLDTGRVRCWGQNNVGQLAKNDTSGSTLASSEVLAPGLTPLTEVIAVAAGYDLACAIHGDSSRWVSCWGYDYHQMTARTTTDQIDEGTAEPVTDMRAITVGRSHACAIDGPSGYVKCWGKNGVVFGDDDDILGVDPIDANTFEVYPQASDVWCQSPAHAHTFGCTTTNSSLHDVISVVAGDFHTCALIETGNVMCWGLNVDGQVGDGTTALARELAEVCASGQIQSNRACSNPLDNVVALAAGRAHTCALMRDGTVRCWGNGVLNPTQVAGLSGVVAISAGGNTTCAVRVDGSMFCWGDADSGRMATGDAIDSASPTSACASGAAGTCVPWTTSAKHTCQRFEVH